MLCMSVVISFIKCMFGCGLGLGLRNMGSLVIACNPLDCFVPFALLADFGFAFPLAVGFLVAFFAVFFVGLAMILFSPFRLLSAQMS